MEAEEPTGEAGEGELVVRHHPVDRVVHAAVGPSQRQPGTEDGAQRRIHDGQQLEAHDEGGDYEVERLHPLRGAGRGAGVGTARGRGAAGRRGGGCPLPPQEGGCAHHVGLEVKGDLGQPIPREARQ